MFQGNDYLHPVKLCTAFLNMAIFVNRPPQKVQLKLSGDAHILKFEIQLIESSKDEKKGGDDSDPEETDEKQHKENKNQSVETTELPPNPDLEKRNHQLESEFASESLKGQQLRAEIDHLERKASELQMNKARSHEEKDRLAREAEERRKQEEHWKEKCIILDSEVKRLAHELEKVEQDARRSKKSGSTANVKRNFEIDDSYRQDI